MKIDELSKLHIEDIKNTEHPSVFFETQEYSILILRLFNKKEQELHVFSKSFVITHGHEIFYYDTSTQEFSELSKREFYKKVDSLVDASMSCVNQLVEEVNTLEESVLENKDIIKEWFSLKKQLSRVERILLQATSINEKFFAEFAHIHKDEELKNSFEDIHEHLSRIYRAAQFNNAKLENIYNLNSALKNEKLNSVIYVLTVISAIFLPLNLIVGFFGMNTEGLFFAGNANGTEMVVAILSGIFVVLALLFMKRKWLNF